MNDPSPTRILVIDDDPAMLTLFRTVIGKSCADPVFVPGTAPGQPADGDACTLDAGRYPALCLDTADSGAQGVKLLRLAHELGRPFSIAFVDLLMPEVDGIETTRRLWAVDPALLVVAMTASEKALRVAELAELGQGDRLLALRKPLHPVEIRQVVRFLDRRKRAERALHRRTLELAERVKELHCLHSISQLMEDTDPPLAELLTGITRLLPAGFQYPDHVLVRIVLNDQAYASETFRETPWKLASPIRVDGRFAGALEVCFRGEQLPGTVTPFLAEERTLVNDVAARLGEIIGRREAEERLRVSEERHRALFESSRDAITIGDASTGKFVTGNPAAIALFGAMSEQQLASVGPWDVSPEFQPDGRPSREKAKGMIDRAIRDGSLYFEWQHKRLDGTEFPATVLLTRLQLGDRVFVQSTVRDITEQKRMQGELAQSQRLEAIGQLAAGIAHEINTPTQYIGDNTRFVGDAFRDIAEVLGQLEQLLASEDAPDAALLDRLCTAARKADLRYIAEEVPHAIEQSLEGVERVADIVRAMKEFSHPGGESKVAVDLNHAVASTLTVCRNEWKYVADLVTDFDPALPPVPCLPGELNQAILNMIINAAHAIAEKVGESGEKGTIAVRTRRNGETAEICIEDTGAGIPEHAQPKIFDLFFTTKPVGQGTGQGLTMARSIIVEKHGGTVAFRSREGEGTTFTICLPLEPTTEEPAAETAAPAAALV